MEPLIINMQKYKYKNEDSAHNLIRYITRTRNNEPKANELISYGFNFGNAYKKPIEAIIKEFEFVQNYYHTSNTLMCHYVIHISDENFSRMNNDFNTLNAYAQECCTYIFSLGFQSCYGIHYSQEKKLHIHLAINTTSFATGKKLSQYPIQSKILIEQPLMNIFNKYIYQLIRFSDLA